MVAKKKVTKKVLTEKEETSEVLNVVEVPEGMEGKSRYLGVPIEEYAEKLLASQSVSSAATEKAIRIEKGLYSQGYDVTDISKVVKTIIERLMSE